MFGDLFVRRFVWNGDLLLIWARFGGRYVSEALSVKRATTDTCSTTCSSLHHASLCIAIYHLVSPQYKFTAHARWVTSKTIVCSYYLVVKFDQKWMWGNVHKLNVMSVWFYCSAVWRPFGLVSLVLSSSLRSSSVRRRFAILSPLACSSAGYISVNEGREWVCFIIPWQWCRRISLLTRFRTKWLMSVTGTCFIAIYTRWMTV